MTSTSCPTRIPTSQPNEPVGAATASAGGGCRRLHISAMAHRQWRRTIQLTFDFPEFQPDAQRVLGSDKEAAVPGSLKALGPAEGRRRAVVAHGLKIAHTHDDSDNRPSRQYLSTLRKK